MCTPESVAGTYKKQAVECETPIDEIKEELTKSFECIEMLLIISVDENTIYFRRMFIRN